MLVKINIDFDEIDLELLVEKIQSTGGEICLAKDSFYLYGQYNNIGSISIIMKELNITNLFIKEITELFPEVEDFIQTWCNERLILDCENNFNEKHQQQLRKMMNTIETVRKNILKEDDNGQIN